MSEHDTLPPDSERTSPNHTIPGGAIDQEQEDESMKVFAGVVGEVVGKELDARLGGILDGINEILKFAQEVPAIKAELAEQRREIESLKAWRERVERLLPGAAE